MLKIKEGEIAKNNYTPSSKVLDPTDSEIIYVISPSIERYVRKNLSHRGGNFFSIDWEALADISKKSCRQSFDVTISAKRIYRIYIPIAYAYAKRYYATRTNRTE